MTAQGKATSSLVLHQEGLSAFLEDPRIPMDNNGSERILRGPAISRHVNFGSGGPAGAKAARCLLSMLATAHLAGLNVYRYLLDWLDACARNEGQAPADLSPWLPWEMRRGAHAETARTSPTLVDPGHQAALSHAQPDSRLRLDREWPYASRSHLRTGSLKADCEVTPRLNFTHQRLTAGPRNRQSASPEHS